MKPPFRRFKKKRGSAEDIASDDGVRISSGLSHSSVSYALFILFSLRETE